MATNYIQDGSTVVGSNVDDGEHVAVEITSGELIGFSEKVTVALGTIPAGADGVIGWEGVYEVPKATGVEFHLGQKLYYDREAANITNVVGTNKDNIPAGICWENAAETATTVKMKLFDMGYCPKAEGVEKFEDTTAIPAVVTGGTPDCDAAAVDTALAAVEGRLDDIETKINALIDALVNVQLMRPYSEGE